VTVGAWGRFSDYSGSGHAMSLTMVGHTLAASALLLLWPGAPWTPWLIPLVIPTAAIFAAAFVMAAHRAMLNYVQETGRVGYTNLWIAGTSLALGLTPIAAGLLIDRLDLAGFEICFAISACAGLVCAIVCKWTVRDHPQGEYTDVDLLNPVLPWRTLARIAWITVGLHPSNRRG
jgi:MFS family permease